MLTRLLLLARLILLLMISIALTVIVAVVAWERLLLLDGNEARFLAEAARKTILFLAVFRRRRIGIGAGLRLILAELLLSRRNQAEVMFGVLIVVFRRDRIAGR